MNKFVAQLYNPHEPDEIKAFSAAFGIFMGIIPIWGLQTLMAIFLAILLKLNKAVVVVFSQVSFPPLLPLVVFLSYRTGAYWMGNHASDVAFGSKLSFATIGHNFAQYLYGSLTLAILAALATGLLTFIALKLAKAVKQYRPSAKLKKAL